MPKVSITAPATTANLGPGFDCLAAALNIENELEAGWHPLPHFPEPGQNSALFWQKTPQPRSGEKGQSTLILPGWDFSTTPLPPFWR